MTASTYEPLGVSPSELLALLVDVIADFARKERLYAPESRCCVLVASEQEGLLHSEQVAHYLGLNQ